MIKIGGYIGARTRQPQAIKQEIDMAGSGVPVCCGTQTQTMNVVACVAVHTLF